MQFEIYFDDLNDDAKKRLCESIGIDVNADYNWDISPLAIFDMEEE